jgi:hypothetical protein
MTAITRGLEEYALRTDPNAALQPMDLTTALAKAIENASPSNAESFASGTHTTRIFALRARPRQATEPSAGGHHEAEAALEACLPQFPPEAVPYGRVEVCVLDLSPTNETHASASATDSDAPTAEVPVRWHCMGAGVADTLPRVVLRVGHEHIEAEAAPARLLDLARATLEVNFWFTRSFRRRFIGLPDVFTLTL